MTVNNEKFDELKNEFVESVVDDMDLDSLMEVVHEAILNRLDDESEQDVLNEIKESVYWDDLKHLVDEG